MIIKILSSIWRHPFNSDRRFTAVFKFFYWQLISRLGVKSIEFNFTKNAKLKLYKGLSASSGNYYNGLFEYYDMAFLLHYLKENDIFVDIGANIGSYTVLAACEKKARVYSFEPVPSTFEFLKENIEINNAGNRCSIKRIAIGDTLGSIGFTSSQDVLNHIAKNGESNVIDVQIETLDLSLSGIKPALIKIDVEGYEMNVIKGGHKVLSNPTLNAIIIEINGLCKNYGSTEIEIDGSLRSYGFVPYYYNPKTRTFTERDQITGFNSIYIRDLELVINRCKDTVPIKVQDKYI